MTSIVSMAIHRITAIYTIHGHHPHHLHHLHHQLYLHHPEPAVPLASLIFPPYPCSKPAVLTMGRGVRDSAYSTNPARRSPCGRAQWRWGLRQGFPPPCGRGSHHRAAGAPKAHIETGDYNAGTVRRERCWSTVGDNLHPFMATSGLGSLAAPLTLPLPHLALPLRPVLVAVLWGPEGFGLDSKAPMLQARAPDNTGQVSRH